MENDDTKPVASPEEPSQPESKTEQPPAGSADDGSASSGSAAATAAGVTVPTSSLGRAIAELQEAQRAGHDRLLRLAADFENFKKRSRKEQNDAVRRAEDKVISDFLPVVDNLERALSHAEPGSSLADGVSMVQKQFLAVLERFGIKPFDSVGQLFDPEHHEAIQQIASPQPPGIICMEAQRGYLRGEKLIRPALVVVSLGPVSPAAKDGAQQSGTESGGGDGGAEAADSGDK
jgi:molecular chaperone GrpE